MKKGLGKGLNALLGDLPPQETGVLQLKINDIEPNIQQPRKNFDDEKLHQLSQSILQHGIVQPIIVKREEETYRIIAGERRWRAARLAGLPLIPAIVKDYSNQALMEVALVENIQREDLNPIEEAEAYEKLLKDYSLTHEELSGRIGKSRPSITNTMRLLNLTEKVKTYLISGDLSAGHARTLLAIENKEKQNQLAEYIIENNLSVRDTEIWIKKILAPQKKQKKSSDTYEMKYLEGNLQTIFGTKVKILHKNNKGKIMIEYFSNDELERILEMVNLLQNNNEG